MIGKIVTFFLLIFLGAILESVVWATGTGTVTPRAVPVVYRDPANVLTSTTYQALISDTEWLVPVELLQQYGRQEIITDGTSGHWVKIVLPEIPVATGKRAPFIPVVPVSAMIQLPDKIVQGRAYTDVWHLTAALGMTFILDSKTDALEVKGATFKSTKIKDLSPTGKIYVMWDPLTGKPYDKKFMADGINVMSPSFMQISKTGIRLDKKKMNQYVGLYQQVGYEVWPLVGNQFDPTLTHDILVDNMLQDQLINELLAYALVYDLQGYNIDFENMKYDDRDRLTSFVQRLYERLHPFRLTLSMDVTAISDSPNWSMVYDREKLAKYLDYMILMAYDQYPRNSKVSGPVASFPWVEESLQRVLQIVPSEKIVLGMPLYMRIWEEKLNDTKKLSHQPMMDKTVSLTMLGPMPIPPEISAKSITEGPVLSNQIAVKPVEVAAIDPVKSLEMTTDPNDMMTIQSAMVTVTAKTLDMTKAAAYRQEHPFDVHWNDSLKLYELQFLTGAVRNKIWFEEEQSLHYKLNLIERYKLKGGAFWRKGFEENRLWSQLAVNNTVSTTPKK